MAGSKFLFGSRCKIFPDFCPEHAEAGDVLIFLIGKFGRVDRSALALVVMKKQIIVC